MRDRVVGVAVGVLILLTMAVPAEAAARGAITGRVTDEVTGQPLAGICVQIMGANVVVTTGVDGRYRARVSPGTYNVFYFECAGPDAYESERYDNIGPFGPATPVVVAAGETTSHISAALRPFGSIGGIVSDSATGEPIPGACVTVLSVNSGFHVSAVTGADGTYQTEPLYTLDYYVDAQSCSAPALHVREWHPGVFDPVDTTPVRAAPGVVTTVDFALDPAGFIAGRVLGGPEGTPLAGVCVSASLASGNEFPLGTGRTDAAGRYRLGGAATGPNIVFFSASCGQLPYEDEYYDNASDRPSATPVEVVAGETARGINARLRAGTCPFPSC